MKKSGIVVGICGVAAVVGAVVAKKAKTHKKKDKIILREIDNILESCETIGVLKDIDSSTGEMYCLDSEENCEMASYIHTIHQLALMLKYLESDMYYVSGYGISSGLKRALTAYDKLIRINPEARGKAYGKDLSKARLSKETKEYLKDCEDTVEKLQEEDKLSRETKEYIKNCKEDIERLEEDLTASDSEQFDGFQ